MKRLKHKLLRTLMGMLLLVIVTGVIAFYGINAFVVSSGAELILSEDDIEDFSVDCILVLGAGVTDDGRPKAMLKDRLDRGITLYQMGVSDRLLMSGDHGTVPYDEVNVMKDFAIAAGLPSENIFMDHAGFSTYESVYRAKEIFQVKRLVIVSQGYHIYRALYIADQLGLEAYGVKAKSEEYPGQSSRDFREKFARVKDFFSVILKPKPEYLGDKIPIDSNGDLTND